MFDDFDFSVLDSPGFKEDAVREDIIAPILRKAGYRASGPQRMERSKPLVHPYVMIGSRKHRINIVPDYTLYDSSVALLVLEAKAPGEAIVKSKHVEQTYSYAIHPEIRCKSYALCNGREIAFYDIGSMGPVFRIKTCEVSSRWGEVEKFLLPAYLKLPELRGFHPDFGLQLIKLGWPKDEEVLFAGHLLQLVTKSRDDLYVAQATCNLGGVECLASFDFDDAVLNAIVKSLPRPQAEQVIAAFEGQPFSIDADAKIAVFWRCRLGEMVKGPHEEFVPLIVTRLHKVEYDASRTVGWQDPLAFASGVKLLQP